MSDGEVGPGIAWNPLSYLSRPPARASCAIPRSCHPRQKRKMAKYATPIPGNYRPNVAPEAVGWPTRKPSQQLFRGLCQPSSPRQLSNPPWPTTSHGILQRHDMAIQRIRHWRRMPSFHHGWINTDRLGVVEWKRMCHSVRLRKGSKICHQPSVARAST